MLPDGFNRMRWDCHKGGQGQNCFNQKRRPKIECFAECFPRRINFGDVDGLVELGGRFCMLEWKGDGGALSRGQHLTYQAFTRPPQGDGNVVLVVEGDAENMAVKRYCIYWRGRRQDWAAGGLSDVKDVVRRWVSFICEPSTEAAE